MNSHRKDEKKKEFVQSLANGLTVIKLFNSRNPAMTLSDLAGKSGLHRATVRRIMLTLEDVGYARRENKLFKLNPAILDLGFSYLSSLPFFQTAQDMLYDLSEKIKDSTSIAVLDGEDIIYVVRMSAKRILTVTLEVGARLPAHATSMGHVLLSTCSDEAIESYLKHSKREKYTKKTLVTAKELKVSFRNIRKNGYSISEGWLDEGLIAIAVPIADLNGKTIAAFNIVSTIFKTNKKKMVTKLLPLMKETAKKLQLSMASNYVNG